MNGEAAPCGGTSEFGHPDFRPSLTEVDLETAGPFVITVYGLFSYADLYIKKD